MNDFKLAHFPESAFINHPSHAQPGIHPFPDKLYVVTMLSNPLRWRARYNNYWKFQKEVEDAGAILYTAEVAFGDRLFEITEPNNPRHLQLRTDDELWHKENALNLMIQRLPADAKYVAWIDADISFARKDWAQEALHQLQHYDFIQMFSKAISLDINHEPVDVHAGFMYCYVTEREQPRNTIKLPPIRIIGGSAASSSSGSTSSVGGSYWHPGFAWAAKIEALKKVGMLLDFCILGSADWHMAWALIGHLKENFESSLHSEYRNRCLEWEKRAELFIQRNVGYMKGSIMHYFHGTKAKRMYGDRWKFLTDANFNPLTDLKYDHQGLYQLNGTNQKLRDGIRAYNRIRNEDEQ